MKPFFQLPENMVLDFTDTPFVIMIVNHHVLSGHGLFYPLMASLKIGDRCWRQTVSEINSKNIRFDVVREQCILDMQNPEKFTMFLKRHLEIFPESMTPEKFSSSITGRKFASEYVRKISACKNWGDFRDIMSPRGIFHKHILLQIKRTTGTLKWWDILFSKVNFLSNLEIRWNHV